MKNKNRRVIWFNMQFCRLTNFNIGKYFLNLLDRHLNRDNPLRTSFDRNSVKISYSCANNMHSILSNNNNHNRRLLVELNRNSRRHSKVSCNSRRKQECPRADDEIRRTSHTKRAFPPVEHNNDGERVYIGIFAGIWKQGLYNHWKSFSNPRLRNQIALSKYFCNLKDQGLTSEIKWKIVRQSSTANSFNGRCNLCSDKKISIINFKDCRRLPNECNTLVFKCKHKSKFKLSWLGATEAPTLDKNKDIDFRWFLLEITYIIVITSIIWRGDLCKERDSWKFRYQFPIRVFNFLGS